MFADLSFRYLILTGFQMVLSFSFVLAIEYGTGMVPLNRCRRYSIDRAPLVPVHRRYGTVLFISTTKDICGKGHVFICTLVAGSMRVACSDGDLQVHPEALLISTSLLLPALHDTQERKLPLLPKC